MIFLRTLDITTERLVVLSPNSGARTGRFGGCAIDDLAHRPEAFDPVLIEVDSTTCDLVA